MTLVRGRFIPTEAFKAIACCEAQVQEYAKRRYKDRGELIVDVSCQDVRTCVCRQCGAETSMVGLLVKSKDRVGFAWAKCLELDEGPIAT